MNTPQPCCECQHLYYDCTTSDKVDCFIECKKELPLGNENCHGFLLSPHSLQNKVKEDSNDN